LLGLIVTITWMALSTALIVSNKRLYSLGFTHPCFVTGMGQVFSALGGAALAKVAALMRCALIRMYKTHAGVSSAC
jgi:hypothetical protein